MYFQVFTVRLAYNIGDRVNVVDYVSAHFRMKYILNQSKYILNQSVRKRSIEIHTSSRKSTGIKKKTIKIGNV